MFLSSNVSIRTNAYYYKHITIIYKNFMPSELIKGQLNSVSHWNFHVMTFQTMI